jgi:mannosyltransferase OCH1-like enzyme
MVDVPHFTEATKKDIAREISGTPLNIYQTWHNNKVDPKMKQCIDKLKATNPEFNHYFYNQEQCFSFIKENFPQEVADAYDSLIPYAYKSDLWRYCVLYKLGGVYLDVKFYTTQSLFGIINKYPEIFVKYVPKKILKESYIDKQIQIYNGFMVSPPNNSIFKSMIDAIVKNTKEKNYTEGPLDITGPMLLANIVMKIKPPEYINEMLFTLKDSDVNNATIFFDGHELCKQYAEYRLTSNTPQPHYSDLWIQRKVYK